MTLILQNPTSKRVLIRVGVVLFVFLLFVVGLRVWSVDYDELFSSIVSIVKNYINKSENPLKKVALICSLIILMAVIASYLLVSNILQISALILNDAARTSNERLLITTMGVALVAYALTLVASTIESPSNLKSINLEEQITETDD